MPIYTQYSPQVLVNWVKESYYEQIMTSGWPLDKILRLLAMGVTRLAQEKRSEGFNPYFEGLNHLMSASQSYFPIQQSECKKISMSLHQVNEIWVNKMRRYNTEEKVRVLPVIFDTRLLKIVICFLHMNRETRSIFSILMGSDFLVMPANSNTAVKMSEQRIISLPSSSPFEMKDRELKLMETKS